MEIWEYGNMKKIWKYGNGDVANVTKSSSQLEIFKLCINIENKEFWKSVDLINLCDILHISPKNIKTTRILATCAQ